MQNKRIKLVKALSQKKERDKEGLFIAEGLRFVKEAKDRVFTVVSDSFLAGEGRGLFLEGELLQVPDGLFQAISATEHPQGILAVVRQKTYTLEELEGDAKGLYLLAEEIQDPGNLGTILRTADACGADGVILTKGTVDVFNPKVLRSTMGSIFHIPVVMEVTAQQAIRWLHSKGIRIYAAHLRGEQTPYTLPLQEGCCFVIGNEAQGLREETAKACDQLVKIPMPGQAESLNAAVAAAILLYEAVRQRQ